MYTIVEIGTLVVVKGMITRASDVKPQISVCTYTCEVCGSEIYQDVRFYLLCGYLYNIYFLNEGDRKSIYAVN